jgi:hypothetical protein
MAWIPLHHETPRKPEIFKIAQATGRSRAEVFLLMVNFWIWIDQIVGNDEGNDVDGRATLERLTLHDIAQAVGADETFWKAVQGVGWLIVDERGLGVPNAGNWFSMSAKARLLKNKRQQRWRDGKADAERKFDQGADDVDGRASTTEQNRTEPEQIQLQSQLQLQSFGKCFLKEGTVLADIDEPMLSSPARLVAWVKSAAERDPRQRIKATDDAFLFVLAAATLARSKGRNKIAYFRALVGGEKSNWLKPLYIEHARRELAELRREPNGSNCHVHPPRPRAAD